MKKKLIEQATGAEIESPIVPSITIDCVIFGFQEGVLEILLVKHASGIKKGEWALPGGWINENESIDAAAERLLNDLTGLNKLYLEQLKAFGSPDRFPLGRVITIGYNALIKKDEYQIKAGFTASEAEWFKIKEVPELIYDHNEILDYSLRRLRRRVRQAPIGFNLLPKKFTLLQLQQLYEEILDFKLDKPNFRRKILKMKLLTDLNEKEKDVAHRAAKLYSFDNDIYQKFTEKGFSFDL